MASTLLLPQRCSDTFKLGRHTGIVFIARLLKKSDDFFVSRPFDGIRPEYRRVTARRGDLLLQPLKVFIRLLAKRQNVDRVLNYHGTELLQFPPYPDTQAGWFLWQLMNEQEPVLTGMGPHVIQCNNNCIVTTVTLQKH